MRYAIEELIELKQHTEEIPYPEDLKLRTEIDGVRIGRLVSAADGKILVDYPDNPFDPVSARTIVSVSSGDENKEVLLVFEQNNPALPIITGIIQKEASEFNHEIHLEKDEISDIIKDGERIVFKAEKEIELRCGKSSVMLKNDGKIIIKGTYLVSRSSGTNKIKGASIQIN